MRLIPSQPVTILADRVDRRYIPHLAVFPDGLLRMNIGIGPDNNFTPGFSYHSYDRGKTWQEAVTPCPRVEWMEVFSDGSCYEIDSYAWQDSEAPDWFVANACVSRDGREFRHEFVRIHAPGTQTATLRAMRTFGQPQEPWYPVINHANHAYRGAFNRAITMDNVMIAKLHMTSIIEIDSPSHLLALAYGRHGENLKCCVWLYESVDAGRTWERGALVMADDTTPEGPDEASLVRLDSGELYAIARTGAALLQARSPDLGRTWSTAEPLRLSDSGEYLTGVWPIIRKLRRGGLVCSFGRPKSTFTSLEALKQFDYVAEHYGHCGKYVMCDPSGTGRNWQGRIDLHELEVAHQALMGVSAEQRLRVQEDTNVRDSNSWEYLTLNEVEDDVLLVTYDVQRFRENWNSHPVQGVRMARVTVQR
ncbi:MAG: hypothetical protein A2498_02085 [Lentisphaerae bacterium RIFOXYC12_FULL_60_16]|nr:MAG: hypothetical protein A2498_02085 [Lentisphaerae bacterium RIFOXYC12_FULL_60_16]